jgi:autotransporter-associated beta strand protein
LSGLSPTASNLTGNGNGIITNNGAAATLTASNPGSSSFAGVIRDGTGALALNKTSAGTLTLLGANTYSGGTMISAGALQIGAGGASGSIAGSVIDNATLAISAFDTAGERVGRKASCQAVRARASLGRDVLPAIRPVPR